MWIFRKFANVKWSQKVTNEEVCVKLNMERTLQEIIKSWKHSYFGHIKRHHSIKKKILEGKVNGKRGRGRPPRRWDDDVKAWTKMTQIPASSNNMMAWCLRALISKPRKLIIDIHRRLCSFELFTMAIPSLRDTGRNTSKHQTTSWPQIRHQIKTEKKEKFLT